MSIRITKKELKENYIVANCSYCDSYYITKTTPIELYNSGVYGWNWNVHPIEYNTPSGKRVIAIVDGYRSKPSSDYKNNKDYEIIAKYNAKARKMFEITRDYKKFEKLQQKLIKELNFP